MTQYVTNDQVGGVVEAPNTDPVNQLWGKRTGDALCTATALTNVIRISDSAPLTVFSVDAREMVASGAYQYA